jgi:hypothetical protein
MVLHVRSSTSASLRWHKLLEDDGMVHVTEVVLVLVGPMFVNNVRSGGLEMARFDGLDWEQSGPPHLAWLASK